MLGADNAPPTEFRIFKAGINATGKGDILFDDQAAKDVMAAYARDGVDLMIDLEHSSIDQQAFANREDAGDARGWFKLALRPGPELWATNVTWTPDGARRLAEKTQRYVSPVSYRDSETGRAVYVLNCAICAMPATYGAEPLVAANRRNAQAPIGRLKAKLARAIVAATSRGMNPKLVQQALEVIQSGDGNAALELLKAFLADEVSEGDPSAAVDPAVAAAASPADPMAPGAQSEPAANSAEYTALRKEFNVLKAKADARELEDQRVCIAELVALGVESPATAWLVRDATAGQAAITAADRIPVPRLAAESAGDMRARLVVLRKNAPARPRPPEGGESPGLADADKESIAAEVKRLRPDQIVAAQKRGMTPEAFVLARRGAVRQQPKPEKK